MIELSLVRDLVAIAGVFIALSYYIINIQHQRETRTAQLYVQIFKELYTPEYWKNQIDTQLLKVETYEEFNEKIRLGDSETYSKLLSQWWIYGELGILVEKGLIDTQDVYTLVGHGIIRQWLRWESIIIRLREEWDNPFAYGHFEVIAKRLMRDWEKLYKDRKHKIDSARSWQSTFNPIE